MMTFLITLFAIWMFTSIIFVINYVGLVLAYGRNNHHAKEFAWSMISWPKELYNLTRTSKLISWFLFFIQFLLYPHLYVLRFLYEVFHKEEESCDDLSD